MLKEHFLFQLSFGIELCRSICVCQSLHGMVGNGMDVSRHGSST